MNLRKVFTHIEETLIEGGRPVEPVARVAVVAVSIANPWADKGFVEDLTSGIDGVSGEVGEFLASRVVAALGAPIEAYGKAGIVGLKGEIEHASGLIHTLQFGDHFRAAASATTLLPAVEKRAAAGRCFDIPLKHVTDLKQRSHHQTVEVCFADAPHADEILIALAAASQGRPQQRLRSFGTDPAATA
ncbi:amino acid synthesis family protein [Paramicrobacterium chengjingii]|uniref:amino acid synthesis family protein n=1 Tax=Paramicrobacterium chengjingii TaxID=2769067 RepID=UPI00141F62D2|nr:amino acid synthesis family protein [Microbacterium chengjingii]